MNPSASQSPEPGTGPEPDIAPDIDPGAERYLLPCGRDVERIWDHLDAADAAGPDEHERTCPHCRDIAEGLRALRAATAELAAEPVDPPDDLIARIMSAVRAEVRRHDLIPLPTTEPGAALVSHQVVASMLRFAADTVEGVRARQCRIITEAEDESGDTDGTDGTGATGDTGDTDAVAVELSIAISGYVFHGGALDEVRERVWAAASARIGLRLARLDLTVIDVYDA